MRSPLLLVPLCAAVACSPHKVTHEPAPPVEVPADYGLGADEAPLPEQWWLRFEDPELNRLVALSLRENLQLKAAWARLKASAAVVAQVRSAKWPQVDLSGTASRSEQRFNLPMIGETTFSSDSFQVSLSAGYEVDLWNRIGSATSSAELQALATRDNVEALAMSTAAQVADTWFALVELQAERTLLAEQLEVSETYLELVEFRFKQGLASALDIYQQEQQVVQTRSALALIEAGIATLQHSLSVLVGEPPRSDLVTAPDALPEVPPPPGIGVPADLLERRPDVRAARKVVEAIDYQVAAAIADRLPGLRLQGSLSLSDSNVTQLIATPLYSLLASVVAPIIDGGRRKAVVAERRAQLEEAVWNYGSTMLQAMLEVENALVQERQQRIYIADLEKTVEVAGNALREARARYRQGLIDYLPVLTSLQVQQRAQVALLQARRQLISYRIQLYRALGGSWTKELVAPEGSAPGGGK